VTFKDAATILGTGTLGGSGKATFTTSALSVATHSITATYSGDGNFNATGVGGSTAPALSQVVNKADSLSTVTSSVNPSVFGQSVTFTATVTAVAPGVGTPSGTVTFKDAATILGTGTLDGSGKATFTTSALSVTTHSITATYSGDGNFNATGATANSTATGLTQTVNKASTTTAIINPTDLATHTVVGQGYVVKFSVSVNSPGSGTPMQSERSDRKCVEVAAGAVSVSPQEVVTATG